MADPLLVSVGTWEFIELGSFLIFFLGGEYPT